MTPVKAYETKVWIVVGIALPFFVSVLSFLIYEKTKTRAEFVSTEPLQSWIGVMDNLKYATNGAILTVPKERFSASALDSMKKTLKTP